MRTRAVAATRTSVSASTPEAWRAKNIAGASAFAASDKFDNIMDSSASGNLMRSFDRYLCNGYKTVSYTHLDVYKRQGSSING